MADTNIIIIIVAFVVAIGAIYIIFYNSVSGR